MFFEKRFKKQPDVLHQVVPREEFKGLLDLNLAVSGAASHTQETSIKLFVGEKPTRTEQLELPVPRAISTSAHILLEVTATCFLHLGSVLWKVGAAVVPPAG